MAAKFTSRTRWRVKLEREDHSKIVQIPPAMEKRFGPGTMLIAKPIEVDALIRMTKKGMLITVGEIRSKLARDHKTNTTCPLTTGIFVRIAAETAEEDAQNGKKRITPYWRVVRDDGSLNEKFPGGVKAQSRRLREEGHTITPAKGKQPPKVRDFAKSLIRL
jgi:hypothetical protein